ALGRARGRRSAARLIFFHNNMGNLLLGRDNAPAAKTEFRWIWHNRSSQTCSGDLAWPEFGAATFVNVGGALRMELFALESPQAPYVKSITLKGTRYWPRRGGSLTGLHTGVLF